MSANIFNALGDLAYNPRTGRSRRMSAVPMSYHGVDMLVQYTTNNCIGSDACVEDVKVVEVNGVDISALLSENQIAEIAERIEQGWDLECCAAGDL